MTPTLIQTLRALLEKAIECRTCKGKGHVFDTTYTRTGEEVCCPRCDGKKRDFSAFIDAIIPHAPALLDAAEAGEKLRAMAAPAVQGVLAKMATGNDAIEAMKANLAVLDRVRTERDKAQHELAQLRREKDEESAMLDEVWHKRLSVSFNTRAGRWIVQREDQVVGNIGNGPTLRAAIKSAMKEGQ